MESLLIIGAVVAALFAVAWFQAGRPHRNTEPQLGRDGDFEKRRCTEFKKELPDW
jgi:hypothetical protein